MRREGQQKLRVVPLTWRQACAFISAHHRHHKSPRGQKFAIGVEDESGTLRGVATCGRPISRVIAQNRLVLEVNRTCTDGFPNANSALYGACYRIAIAMGYTKVITDTQEGESGASLRAAGYKAGEPRPPRQNWANSSVKLRDIRDTNAMANVSRTRWTREASV